MIKKEIVFTGIGVVSPIGTSCETYWNSLLEQRSGVGFVDSLGEDCSPRQMGAEVRDFNPKQYFRSKKEVKQIKVMSRDIQLAYAAAMLACSDAGLKTEATDRNVEPDRLAVSYGADMIGLEIPEILDAYKAGITDGKYDKSTWGPAAMKEVYPLWMLKYLPNMPACHIAITHDARGPNNSFTMQRGASLAALFEAVRILERGAADVVISGGCGNCLNPSFLARAKAHHLAPYVGDPGNMPRPYDAERNGNILGEGAAAFILETKEFAQARGAKIYATVRGFCNRTDPRPLQERKDGRGIRQTLRGALADAAMQPQDLGYINAEGLGTLEDDTIEANAIRAELGDIPVTALKGYFGSLGCGAGAVELVGSLLALQHGLIPVTKNCDRIAEDCPINVVRGKPQTTEKRTVLKLNNGIGGRSFAFILEKEGRNA